MAKKTERFTVIRDSREKDGHGWQFAESDACAGTVVRGLKTGDYSLDGYESVFAIERKGSVQEFVQNITTKDKWECFREELSRLVLLPAAFVVCEFTLDDVMGYPHTTDLPWHVKRKVRVSPQFYLKRLIEIELHFKARVQLLGRQSARDYASSLFKRVVERWPQPPTPSVSNARPAA